MASPVLRPTGLIPNTIPPLEGGGEGGKGEREGGEGQRGEEGEGE